MHFHFTTLRCLLSNIFISLLFLNTLGCGVQVKTGGAGRDSGDNRDVNINHAPRTDISPSLGIGIGLGDSAIEAAVNGALKFLSGNVSPEILGEAVSEGIKEAKKSEPISSEKEAKLRDSLLELLKGQSKLSNKEN